MCLTSEGTDVRTTFQVGDIQRPVLSVSKLTENGCDVKFTKSGGVITTKSGAKIKFKRMGGFHVLVADIKPTTTRRIAGSHVVHAAPSSMDVDIVNKSSVSHEAQTTFHRQGR